MHSCELFVVDFEQVSNYKEQRPLYTIRTWPFSVHFGIPKMMFLGILCNLYNILGTVRQ